jgi:hypothetical protein
MTHAYSNLRPLALAMALASAGLPGQALAASDAERLTALEAQIRQQQQEMVRLKQAARTTAPKFAPDVSLILSGNLTRYSGEDGAIEHTAGFAPEQEGTDEGFSIGHTEFVLSGNIDPYFYGQFIAAFHEHEGEVETEIEDASITHSPFAGATLKAGRYLSAFGYNNEHHEHAWDISTAPLAYRYVFGGALVEDGLQVNYITPTDTFLKVGGEALRGRGEPATASDRVGAWTAYVNAGGDLDQRTSWLLGASHYRGDSDSRDLVGEHAHEHADGEEHEASFTGDTRVSGLEVVLKHAPSGNMKTGHVKLQAEYLSAKSRGDVALTEPGGPTEQTAYRDDRDGYYVQASWQWDPQWRTSVRHDVFDTRLVGDADILGDLEQIEAARAEQLSLALDWMGSEFSRVRLQYSLDHVPGDERETLLLNYTVSLGAHGAHTY